jgi:hypothetical protein
MDIAAWLDGLGLGQYKQAFRSNDIDKEVLHGLTAEDLRELGVASIGHRRRLLDAIARLVDGHPSAAASPTPSGAAVSSDAERRQLTVMFCDLVGSTGARRSATIRTNRGGRRIAITPTCFRTCD